MSKLKGFDRRQFVALGVSSAAAVAISPRLMAAGWSAAPAAVAGVAVGFCDGRFTNGGAASQGPVSAAHDLLAGDPEFNTRGARISIYGMNGGETQPLAHPKNRIELTSHFSVFDGVCQRLVPFQAWSYSREASKKSSPLTFVVPVADEKRVVLSVAGAAPVSSGRGRTIARGGGAAAAKQGVIPSSGECTAPGASLPHNSAETFITLATGSDTGPKLQRGFYFIAPLAMGESEPRWSGLELRSTWVEKEKAMRWLLHEGREPVDFEYLVLWVDWAKYDLERSPNS